MTAKKNHFHTFLVVVAFFVLGFCFHTVLLSKTRGGPPHKETAYARVMRTDTIRCGYVVWPPALIKDPNTGKLSGIYYDYLEALGRALHIKIEWTKELDLATYISDLNDGKIDLECAGGWPDPLRGKQLIYSRPIFFLPFYLYAREGDERFDRNLEAVNDPTVRFAIMDGDFSALTREERFSKTQRVSVPSNGPFANLFLEIVYNKADITGADAFTVEPYFRANPGKIRRIASPPLKVVPNNLSMAHGEEDFRNMINVATEALLYEGTIDRILDKYDPKDGTLFRINKPYAVPSP